MSSALRVCMCCSLQSRPVQVAFLYAVRFQHSIRRSRHMALQPYRGQDMHGKIGRHGSQSLHSSMSRLILRSMATSNFCVCACRTVALQPPHVS